MSPSLPALFHQRFNRSATIHAIAPGRVNLIGEHTDYNDGFVLPIAIERDAEIIAEVAAADFSTFRAIDIDDEITIDLRAPISPMSRGHWANHLLGVAQQFREAGAELKNVDLILQSTVPIGAGLSSSAAIEVAVAHTLQHVTRLFLDPVELAHLCQRAEHTFVGTPCGIMDMLVSAAAVKGHAILIDCRTLRMRPIRFPSGHEASLLIVNTGVSHDLASGEYAQRRAECERAADALGVPALRDATIEQVSSGLLPESERRRALHVVKENRRTLQAALRLEREELSEFGELMFASHRSLRELFEVSCPELDTVVDLARAMSSANEGVYGARMTGGGFGGCAIVLCRPEASEAVVDRLGRVFRERHGRIPELLRSGAAGGAASVRLG